ncbi:fumarylacetoacetate hydrolase family protein [Mesobacillus maritimus]|uniref:fumarylacetoacetate hydrolase family protein n=1 Tax=Mesobacillus maritimus TaxID=1643336 RepID=UPI00384FB080
MIFLKLTTFFNNKGEKRAGWVENNRIYDCYETSNGDLPDNVLEFIKNHERYLPKWQQLKGNGAGGFELNQVTLTAPLPNPPSVRDFIAFEEHMVNAGKRVGLPVAPEWYEIPVFYFSNHLAIRGHNEEIERPPFCHWLDYELEIACVIGKEGKNIQADEAEDYIFGYTILNDWSARDLQSKEMKVGLGPAKGKDFANSIGPYIVTKDELESYRMGERYDLNMTAKVNGKILSEGNFKNVYYTFGQMIERAAQGVTLYPGDIIGSGTVGKGCLLELGPDVQRWLEPGDTVELEIDAIGKLTNRVI